MAVNCVVPVNGAPCGISAVRRCALCSDALCATHVTAGNGGLVCPSCLASAPGQRCEQPQCQAAAGFECRTCHRNMCRDHMHVQERYLAPSINMDSIEEIDVCRSCQEADTAKRTAASQDLFAKTIDWVVHIVGTEQPAAYREHAVTVRQWARPKVGGFCPADHEDCRSIRVASTGRGREWSVTFGEPFFQLWEYEVVFRWPNGELGHRRRGVYVRRDGSLVTDNPRENLPSGGGVGPAPIAILAMSGRRVSLRDLVASDFGNPHPEPTCRGIREFVSASAR